MGGSGALLPVEREDLCAEDAHGGLELLRRERDASACMRRHQASALAPVTGGVEVVARARLPMG